MVSVHNARMLRMLVTAGSRVVLCAGCRVVAVPNLALMNDLPMDTLLEHGSYMMA